jgi:hypothetical protein
MSILPSSTSISFKTSTFDRDRTCLWVSGAVTEIVYSLTVLPFACLVSVMTGVKLNLLSLSQIVLSLSSSFS